MTVKTRSKGFFSGKGVKTTALVLAALVVITVLTYLFISKVVILDTTGELVYVYGEKDIHVELTKEESETIREILNGKSVAYGALPSCGFTPDISIRFGLQIFQIACDTCGAVMCGIKYIELTNEERTVIDVIFAKYGGTFPAI